MRRKSHRNTTKASPEKVPEPPSRRSRRHSKRRRRSSSQSSSEGSDNVTLKPAPQQPVEVVAEPKAAEAAEDETAEQQVWKVTPSTAPSGEIQKLKICLTRPIPSSPEKNERPSRRRRNKSGLDEDIASPEEKTPTKKTRQRGSPVVIVEEQEEEHEEQEDKKGKGKSKTKHRSKSEKTPQIQEVEDQTQSEISENVQVTPQSPQAAIDIRVDNESVSTIQHETVTTDETETCSVPQNTDTSEICEQIPEKPAEDHTPPQSPQTEPNIESTKHSDSFDSQGNFKGFSAPEQTVVEESGAQQNIESAMEEDAAPAVQEEALPEISEKQVQVESPEQATVLKDGVEDVPAAESEDVTSDEIQEPVSVAEQPASSEVQEDPSEVEMPEQKPEEGMEVDESESEPKENKIEEQTAPELKEESSHLSESKEGSSQLSVGHESKPESPSSEEAEHAVREEVASPGRDKEVEPATEDQASPVDNKDVVLEESSSKSVITEETHRSDEDSRSVDAIILDNSRTPSKEEDTSFNLTQSFSPDVRQIVEANKELQDMRQEVLELFQTPPKVRRKSNWGNSLAGLELLRPSLTKINIDTIKGLCPELKFLEESEVKIDVREAKDRRKSYSLEQKERRVDRKVSIECKTDDPNQRRVETQSSVNSSEMEEAAEPEVDNSNIIAMNRKISIVDDTASKLKPPPSPAKNPVAEVLYISNLVRPFTLKQLKELLERTGKIKENGFWTDRIKSKCYVHYDTIEEAEATRNALHGVHWPIGNGKKLIIDYATQEDLEKARNPTPPPPVAPEPKIPEKETQEEPVPAKRGRLEDHEKPTKERERHKSEGHMREWDIGKENVHKLRSRSKEREGRNERNDRRRHRRTPSPVEDFITRKQRKKEEDIPQKLMDDLFRKTKATPSIYWLPLTPEEITTKQQQRLLRMAEHKRRMEESSRGRGDYGRGAPYRRRYD